jgi:two-component system NtrC family sensor kinase
VTIAAKMTLLLVAPLVLLMAVFGYVDDRRSTRELHTELVREGRAVIRTMQLAMEDYFRDRDLQDVQELVDKVTLYERILGLRVFNADGELIYQSSSLIDQPFVFGEALRRVLREGRVEESERKINNEPTISFLAPLTSSTGTRFGALQVLQLGSFMQEAARVSRQSILLVTLIMALAVTVTVYLISYFNLSRPTRLLVHSFRDVGSGDLDVRVPIRSHDEFGRLAQEFNTMAERLDEAERVVQAEQDMRHRAEEAMRMSQRLVSLGRLSAGLAHEIGTPLNVISGRVEALQRKIPADETAQRNVQIILSQIDRIARTVHGMLDFARARSPQLKPVDLGKVLHSVIEFLDPRFERRGIEVQLALPEDLPAIAADPDQLSQVFLNLSLNAVEAMAHGGRLRIEVSIAARRNPLRPDDAESEYASVLFADSGHGIPPDVLTQVFDPFFTTKDVGEGSGLGLSIAYGIVQEHGGWIDVVSAVDQGTRITVNLPLDSLMAGGAEP